MTEDRGYSFRYSVYAGPPAELYRHRIPCTSDGRAMKSDRYGISITESVFGIPTIIQTLKDQERGFRIGRWAFNDSYIGVCRISWGIERVGLGCKLRATFTDICLGRSTREVTHLSNSYLATIEMLIEHVEAVIDNAEARGYHSAGVEGARNYVNDFFTDNTIQGLRVRHLGV